MLLRIYFMFSVLLFGAVQPQIRADVNENISSYLPRKSKGGINFEDYIATAARDMDLPNVSNRLNLSDSSRLVTVVQEATKNILDDLTKGMRDTPTTPSFPKLISVQVLENILRETIAIVTNLLMNTLLRIL